MNPRADSQNGSVSTNRNYRNSRSESPAKVLTDEARRFRFWMDEVTVLMEGSYGFHPDDISDCPYADWHVDGMTPLDAVGEAILLNFGGAI